ncbi:DUF748 domain-containing protein [Hydrogenophaga sp.]|uniref:DUF748 domain-containing protein n=1 Tax=Hydrogenophaga sp. TaxID=1904254 RepID=UPI002AC8F704|nr:DUF748 domain-containing protein [Hydrogenophaga sp.]
MFFTSPWVRRMVWTLGGVLLLWLITWLAVPVLLKWQLQNQVSQALGRSVTVQKMDFRPWSLALSIEGLRIASAQGSAEQVSVARVHVNAELQSVLRLAPVIDALKIEQPRVTLMHLGGGRYDVDDIVQRLRVPPSDAASDPARFALFNIELQGGEFTLVDDTVGATHRLRGLTVSIPALDLAPYFPCWPATWPIKPEAGVLQLDLKLSRVERLARRVDLASIELKAPSLSLSRDTQGQLNLARPAQGFAPAGPEKLATAEAPVAEAAPWDIRLARFDLDDGLVQWRDDAVKPSADTVLSALRVQTSGLRWPVSAPMPFEVSAQLDQTAIGIQGTATDLAAQAELSLGDISLGRFAPYISSALKPALEG